MGARPNPHDGRFTRRRFLSVTAGFGFGVYTSASGAKIVAQESTPVATPFDPANLKEAPALAEQVAAGAIPPVAERVGANPLVVPVTESIGQYGGTWRTGLVGGQDTAWLDRTVGYDNLLRWDPGWNELIPNIAESYELNADSSQFTFKLREGMKWSDGAPFTSRDIEFRTNDVYRNPALESSLGDNPASIEVIDELTFTITLERPDGLFLQTLATVDGNVWTTFPAHYLEQFHEDYNTTNLDQLIEENGVADWIELFRLKGGSIPGTPYNAVWANPELPRLHAHRLVEPYGDAVRVTFERNPYYWKVDPDGNQLPYLDGVNYDIAQDNEVMLLKAIAGELDFHSRHIVSDANKSVLAQNQESGQYHLFDTLPASMNTCALALNLTHKDPALREVFSNKDFRIGLSHAINRQEIIDTVYVSQGEPWQLAPRRETPFFNETLAKQYTEFDVDLANQTLDTVLPDKDGDGFRLMSNGTKLSFGVAVAAGGDPARQDATNLVVGYWRAVGVDCQLDPIDRSLLYTRKAANDHDCVVWGGDGGLKDAILDPRWYFPSRDESNYGIPWAYWYLNQSNAQAEPEEPPEATKQQMELYDQLKATSDPDEQNPLFAQILEIAQQEFYAIGVSLNGPGYGIVKNNFRNVPAEMPDAYFYVTPGPTNPEQYFIEQ